MELVGDDPGEVKEEIQRTIRRLQAAVYHVLELEGTLASAPDVGIVMEDVATAYEEFRKRVDGPEELTDPRLAPLGRQYRELPQKDRMCGGKERTWDEVVAAITSVPHFLAGIDSLTQACVYFIDGEGRLVVGDGSPEVPNRTLGVSHSQSMLREARITYIDKEERVVVVDSVMETPLDVQVIVERGIITEEECRRISRGQFENVHSTWLGGHIRSRDGYDACWDSSGAEGGLRVGQYRDDPSQLEGSNNRGSRCVIVAALDFTS